MRRGHDAARARCGAGTMRRGHDLEILASSGLRVLGADRMSTAGVMTRPARLRADAVEAPVVRADGAWPPFCDGLPAGWRIEGVLVHSQTQPVCSPTCPAVFGLGHFSRCSNRTGPACGSPARSCPVVPEPVGWISSVAHPDVGLGHGLFSTWRASRSSIGSTSSRFGARWTPPSGSPGPRGTVRRAAAEGRSRRASQTGGHKPRSQAAAPVATPGERGGDARAPPRAARATKPRAAPARRRRAGSAERGHAGAAAGRG
jgi:hypothetical protein